MSQRAWGKVRNVITLNFNYSCHVFPLKKTLNKEVKVGIILEILSDECMGGAFRSALDF